jgi:hypothetical protein
MILKPFRADRFGFLPELFAINSRRFYHDLSTGKESITIYAPCRSVAMAFIRLVQGQRTTLKRAIAPAVYQLCLEWDVALPILDAVRAYLGHSNLAVAVNRSAFNIARSLGVAPDGSPNASSASHSIRGNPVRHRRLDVRRDSEEMPMPDSGGYIPAIAASGGTKTPTHSAMAADVRRMGGVDREPNVAPAAVGGIDGASEPEGSPDVDPIVTGSRASGGVEAGPDTRNLAKTCDACGIPPRCRDRPTPPAPPPQSPDEMPVVLQPGTELVGGPGYRALGIQRRCRR